MRLRLNIGTKMQLGFALVIVFMLAMVYVGITGLTDVIGFYEDEVLRINDNRRFAAAIQTHVLEQSRAVTEYVLVRDQDLYAFFDEARTELGEALARLQARTRTPEAQLLVGEIALYKEDLEFQIESIFTRQNLSPGEGIQLVSNVLAQSRAMLFSVLDELIEFQSNRMEEAQQQAAAARDTAQRVMLIVSGVAVVVGIAVAFFMTRGIAGPVRRVAEAARRLADGDLRVQALGITSRDEVGDMGRAFEQMARTLRNMLGQVQRTSRTVMEHGRQLLAISDESAGATAQIAAAVQQVSDGAATQVQRVQQTLSGMNELRQAIDQIASGAHEQAQQVEQTTRNLDEMVGVVDEVADSARQVADAARRGTERAEAGGEAVEQVTEGMDVIRTSSGEVAQRVRELNGYSRQIGQIVDVIGDIAEQTNLLALNAAIEAARAGEHGRGFGVVAEEVRQLAERSASSTRDIGRLIGDIQTAVDAAVQAIDEGTDHVRSGTDLAHNARQALNEIIESIDETARLAQVIEDAAQRMATMSPRMLESMTATASVTQENTAATEEMAASSAQVVQSMDEVAAISEETAAGTEQVSASTEEVNAAADEMRASVETLTNVAEELERIAGRFRLE